MRVLCVFAAGAILAAGAAGQTPAFEVASVRPAQETGGRGIGHGLPRIRVEPGAVTMRGVSFRTCVRWAYNVTDFQVNGPDWIDGQRYEIAAKAGGPATEDQLRLMLQSLLAERFKLELHRQTKEAQAWVLTVARNGPKFKESAEAGEMQLQADQKRFEISATRMPISDFIDFLSPILRAPIIDQTGLKGRYDAKIDVMKYIDPTKPMGINEVITTLTSAIPQALGLDLKERKMPIEFVVIDRAEKTPVEN